MVTKGHTYLNKPAAFSCRFVPVCVTYCYHQALKGTIGKNAVPLTQCSLCAILYWNTGHLEPRNDVEYKHTVRLEVWTKNLQTLTVTIQPSTPLSPKILRVFSTYLKNFIVQKYSRWNKNYRLEVRESLMLIKKVFRKWFSILMGLPNCFILFQWIYQRVLDWFTSCESECHLKIMKYPFYFNV